MSALKQAVAIGDRMRVVGCAHASANHRQPPDGDHSTVGLLSHVTSSHRRVRARAAWLSSVLAAVTLMAGCGAPKPNDYGGTWTPVNRFQNAPVEIPLSPAYTFYASPMDGTLQTMLKRWAADNGLQLNYQAGADFTLYQPVAKIRTAEIQVAVAELSAIYVAQGVAITADPKQILVRSTGATQLIPGSR